MVTQTISYIVIVFFLYKQVLLSIIIIIVIHAQLFQSGGRLTINMIFRI